MPNPEPPEVTRSPELLRSLARPETGWPKSQKYLKVCFCTSVSRESSVIRGNLSVVSMAVLNVVLIEVLSFLLSLEMSVLSTFNSYRVRFLSGFTGLITITLSLLARVILRSLGP